jgi:hypothetical protein
MIVDRLIATALSEQSKDDGELMQVIHNTEVTFRNPVLPGLFVCFAQAGRVGHGGVFLCLRGTAPPATKKQ